MVRIVLVHGVGQTQQGADTLEAAWLPALAAGVRRSGHPDVADTIWPQDPRARTARMAHYGDLYLAPGSQGGDSVTTPDDEDLLDDLALEWLHAAAARATDPRDRADAAQALAAHEHATNPGAQGARAAGRPLLNALTRLRWFAPLGLAAAGSTVHRALAQVPRYLDDPLLRATAQGRVLDLIDTDTQLVIGHSLGSVVAYEALHHTSHPTAFITLGSPLGMRTLVYDKLQPQPPSIPTCVTAWHNFADIDDLVAAVLDLAPHFPSPNGTTITTNSELDNDAKPHDAVAYLTKKSVGDAVTAALTTG